MSRTTTILALLQTFLVILGFCELGIVLKLSGYPDSSTVRWSPLTVFLREHGVWLILLPVVWVFFATSVQRFDRGFFSYRFACIIGFVICGFIITFFLYAALFPYTRVFLIHAFKP